MGNFEENQNLDDELVTVKTPTCMQCGQAGEVNMLMSEYRKLLGPGHIQNALPNHSPDEREMLITGTHPACWKAMTELWEELDDEDTDKDVL